jgi:ubiquinone/menaquinone biosynthesis C-methylase UbiE
MGNKQNQELGVDDKFKIQLGSMSSIPFEDNHFDFVFCSDVIGLVEDLDSALKECARVLKPGGKALVYATSFKTQRLSKDEEEFLDESLAGHMRTVEEVEIMLGRHFTVKEKNVIGSQFGQYAIEQQGADSEAAKNLVKIARLQTWPEKYIEKYGEKRYQIVLAEVMWSPFILLGKLEPTVFILQKESV